MIEVMLWCRWASFDGDENVQFTTDEALLENVA